MKLLFVYFDTLDLGIYGQSSMFQEYLIKSQVMKLNWKLILSMFLVLMANSQTMEKLSIYFGLGDSAINNKQWDHPPFDLEILASLDKDLEQLSKEEQHLLRQI